MQQKVAMRTGRLKDANHLKSGRRPGHAKTEKKCTNWHCENFHGVLFIGLRGLLGLARGTPNMPTGGNLGLRGNLVALS